MPIVFGIINAVQAIKAAVENDDGNDSTNKYETKKGHSYYIKKENTTVNDVSNMQFKKCVYLKASDKYQKNHMPDNMFISNKSFYVGNTVVNKNLDFILGDILGFKQHIKPLIEVRQYTLNAQQIILLEQQIQTEIERIASMMPDREIPGPIYVSYAKRLHYDTNYLLTYFENDQAEDEVENFQG